MEVLWEGSFEITRDLKTDKNGIPKHLLRRTVLANEAKISTLHRCTQTGEEGVIGVVGVLAYAGKRRGYGGFE